MIIRIVKAVKGMICPKATQDVTLNTKNRNATRENHMYGPLNVEEPGDYWEKLAKKWDTSEKAAKKSTCGVCVAFDISPRMDDCMPGSVSDDSGRLGYCWMHHFKCHSARSCDTWATGGPIKEDKVSYEWQKKGDGMDESADPKMKKYLDSHPYMEPDGLQEEWSKSERDKRKSKCANPKGFTMKQFCKNQRTRSKKGQKTN